MDDLRPDGSGQECFFEADGRRQDAGLHDEILGGVDDTDLRRWSVEHAVSCGVPRENALREYGLA